MTADSGPSGRRTRAFLLAAVLPAFLASSAARAQADAWWEGAVFYEVFVRSFQDSDGDGVGDLRGLIQRLDYLNDGNPQTDDDLGVTALWLMPICESPSYHGYDVTDYYAVNPDYGTLDDVRDLLAEAHGRGIRVVVDLVLNHTSSDHPWFQASRGPQSDYRDWYIWSTIPPSYLGPWGEPVWHFGGTGYYYGVFWSGMPDLNYRNPAVSTRMFDVVRFWLEDVGVDGFRLDAVRHLIENGEQQVNTPATHFWLKGLRAVSKGWNEQALLLGEVWDEPSAVLPYDDQELDICFEFSLAEAILSGVRRSSSAAIEEALDVVLATYPAGRYATFLSNHDQERTMTRLAESEDAAKLAASILLTLPGTPFLYYGEEIGMTGSKPDEHLRTPMQWSSDPGAGFTTGTPWESTAVDAFHRTVADQTGHEDSLLSHYRRMIRLRTACPALSVGSTTPADSGHPSILSYVRDFDGRTVWVLHNLSAFRARASKIVAESGPLAAGDFRAVDLLGGVAFDLVVGPGGELGNEVPSIPAYGTLILEVIPTP